MGLVAAVPVTAAVGVSDSVGVVDTEGVPGGVALGEVPAEGVSEGVAERVEVALAVGEGVSEKVLEREAVPPRVALAKGVAPADSVVVGVASGEDVVVVEGEGEPLPVPVHAVGVTEGAQEEAGVGEGGAEGEALATAEGRGEQKSSLPVAIGAGNAEGVGDAVARLLAPPKAPTTDSAVGVCLRVENGDAAPFAAGQAAQLQLLLVVALQVPNEGAAMAEAALEAGADSGKKGGGEVKASGAYLTAKNRRRETKTARCQRRGAEKGAGRLSSVLEAAASLAGATWGRAGGGREWVSEGQPARSSQQWSSAPEHAPLSQTKVVWFSGEKNDAGGLVERVPHPYAKERMTWESLFGAKTRKMTARAEAKMVETESRLPLRGVSMRCVGVQNASKLMWLSEWRQSLCSVAWSTRYRSCSSAAPWGSLYPRRLENGGLGATRAHKAAATTASAKSYGLFRPNR